MTALSIPERARKIAHQMADSVAIPLWAHESCVRNFVIVIESAMRSERELCAKELEQSRKPTMWSEESWSIAMERAAKLLRKGGQK